MTTISSSTQPLSLQAEFMLKCHLINAHHRESEYKSLDFTDGSEVLKALPLK